MIACLALLGLGLQANPLVSRVVVVENADSAASVEIGEYYMAKRHVVNRLLVHCQDSSTSTANETIPYAAFNAAIEAPLRAYLGKHPKVDFVVLTKGVPIRITGAPGLGH